MLIKQSTSSTAAMLCVLLVFLVSTVAAKEPVKVYLLGGQSNMVGSGNAAELSGVYANPQNDVRFWQGNSWSDLAPGAKNFGPEIAFGRAMKDAHPNEEIYLIKYAASGTALYNDWSPTDGPQYKRFMQTARAAIAKLEEDRVKYEIVGMLWMQGESDAHEGKAETYEKNLRDFIAHMREQFEAPEMRFVIARVRAHYGGNTGQAKIVRDAQVAVAKSTEGVDWFDTDDYPMLNAGHYNGEGLIRMGEDFAKAFPLEPPARSEPPSPPEKHTFRSADGKNSFVAVLKGYDPESGLVEVIKSDRSKIKFSIELLSSEDQEFVRTQPK